MSLIRRCYGSPVDLIYCDECQTCCEVNSSHIFPLSKVHHDCDLARWDLPELSSLAKGIRR